MPWQTTHAVKRKFALSPKRPSLPVSQPTATSPTSEFLVEMLNAALNMDTGELMEMRHLLVNPKYKEVWGKLYTTELGQLAQGIPGISKGSDTIVFI
jgi:hypothetical protein